MGLGDFLEPPKTYQFYISCSLLKRGKPYLHQHFLFGKWPGARDKIIFEFHPLHNDVISDYTALPGERCPSHVPNLRTSRWEAAASHNPLHLGERRPSTPLHPGRLERTRWSSGRAGTTKGICYVFILLVEFVLAPGDSLSSYFQNVTSATLQIMSWDLLGVQL